MASIIKVDQIQTAAGGTPTAADLGLNVTGAVLQVVKGTATTQTNITASSFADTGLSASITPSSTSSKILILTDQTGWARRYSNDGWELYFRVLRDGATTLKENYNFARAGLGYASEYYSTYAFPSNILDEPNTTSSVEYKTQARLGSGYTGSSAAAGFQPVNYDTFMILIEIAG